MLPYKTDIAVLILFFNRPQSLQKVFDAVREARPSRLFLYQDGPRGDKDMDGIEACRRVVENVDWECEVHRSYQTENAGCDPSNFRAQKWAFSMADKCILLEDDSIPTPSFFPFCKEMLDRYEHDNRVGMISGLNLEEKTDGCTADYFFTSAVSIWGWASWRRVVDKWDEHYTWLDNPEALALLEQKIKDRGFYAEVLQAAHDHKASGKAYYETILWAHLMLNEQLAIVPARNMIKNIGLTDDSVHYGSSLKTIPHDVRRLFTMERYDVTFPLKHPQYMIERTAYRTACYRQLAWGYPSIKMRRSLEELWLNLRYGNFGAITKAVRKRLGKWLGTEKYK